MWGLSLVAVGLCCGVQVSHCGGFSCEAQALGTWASIVVAPGLNSYGAWG